MTRQEIESLKPGIVLERTLDTVASKPQPNACWTFRGEITEISYRGTSVQGRAYVGGYTKFGDNNGKLSFSISEGQEHVRIVPPEAAQ